MVGKAIKGRRDKVVLATKCGLVWHTDKGNHFFDESGKSVHRYLGAESIRYEVEQSLRRLQTDCIDLYQTHWQDPTTPIEETMGTLLELKQEGKIRAIGVSNATVEQMDEYRKAGTARRRSREVQHAGPEDGRGASCPTASVRTSRCWPTRPLAQGLLTGKVTADRVIREGDYRADDPRFSVENRTSASWPSWTRYGRWPRARKRPCPNWPSPGRWPARV